MYLQKDTEYLLTHGPSTYAALYKISYLLLNEKHAG